MSTSAESIVAQALTSHTQHLRHSARLVGHHLRAAKAARLPAAPADDSVAGAQTDHDAGLAARLLIDLVSPRGEPLAIRIERATNAQALAPLIGQARLCIANVRGEAAARAAGDTAAKLRPAPPALNPRPVSRAP